MARHRHSVTNLAANSTLAAGYAAATVWYRMWMLGSASMLSDAARQAEANRMITEKLSASFQGCVAAAMETMKVAASIQRRPSTPMQTMQAAAAIADAGLRPGLKRARANSKRLRRRVLRAK